MTPYFENFELERAEERAYTGMCPNLQFGKIGGIMKVCLFSEAPPRALGRPLFYVGLGIGACLFSVWTASHFVGAVAGKSQIPQLTRAADQQMLSGEFLIEKWLIRQRADKLNRHVAPIVIDSTLLRDKEKLASSKSFELSLYLMPKVEYIMVAEKGRVQSMYDKEMLWTWTGSVKGLEGSTVTISCSEQGVVNGSVRTPTDNFQIRPAPPWQKNKDNPRLHVAVLLDDDGLPTGQASEPRESQGPVRDDSKKKLP